MMTQASISRLANREPFSRIDIYNVLARESGEMKPSTFEVKLKDLLVMGQIVRVGRNSYCLANNLSNYEFKYSERAHDIANILKDDFFELEFRVMELYQLNRFLNHQIGHNVYFVYVESDLLTTVFERLKESYPGEVLIDPTEDLFFTYKTDDIIVVKKLITESPKGKQDFWATSIEKMLVDVFSDKLLQANFSRSELPAIFEGAFDSYAIDESQLFRYAKRRKTASKIKIFLQDKTEVVLRTQ